jgi:import inner membrane translocase subunit TIM54
MRARRLLLLFVWNASSQNFCGAMRPSHRRLSTSPPSPGPVESSKKGAISSGGAFDALEHTGIPKSWLRRPRLPSRNWLIFWGAVSSLSCLYWYDRRQCRLIKEEYIARVQHFSEATLDSKEMPRRVDVYACKWPGDEEYDRSLKFFKRYVKVNISVHVAKFVLKQHDRHGSPFSSPRRWTMHQRMGINMVQYPTL